MGEFHILRRILGVIKHVHETPPALPPVSLSAAPVLTSTLPVFQMFPLAHSMLLFLITTFGVFAQFQFPRTSRPSQLTQKGFKSEYFKSYSIIGKLKDIGARRLRVPKPFPNLHQDNKPPGDPLCWEAATPSHSALDFYYNVIASWEPLIMSPP